MLLCYGHIAPQALDTLLSQYAEEPAAKGTETTATAAAAAADTGGLIWANRNVFTGANANRLDGLFGANVAAATAVIDAAFAAWRRVISNFNQDGGNNQLDVYVFAETTGAGGFGGSGGPTALIGNKPRVGSVNIARGNDTNNDGVGDGAGWFLDPTPNEHSEWGGGQILNAFAANPTPGGAADGMGDLFSLVVVELAHALGMANNVGLAWRNNPLFTNLGQADVRDAPGTLWAFTSGSTRILMTSNNGGGGGTDTGLPIHVAYPPNSASYLGNGYFGIEDCGTAGGDASIRYLPSHLMARMLSTVYGYTWTAPETFGTFYAMQRANGSLLIRGGEAVGLGFPSNDSFALFQSGGNISVLYNIGNIDLGDYPIGTISSVFTAATVTSISIDGRTGNDVITLNPISSSIPITVNGGGGDDRLEVHGSAGDDTITANSFSLTSTGLNVTSMQSIDSIVLYPGTGVAHVYLPAVFHDVTINGDVGVDNLVLHQVSFANNSVVINSFGGNDTITLAPGGGSDKIESPVVINAGGGFDTINLAPVNIATPVISQPITVFGGTENDTLNIAGGNLLAVTGSISYDGGGGSGDGIALNNAAHNTLNWLYGVYATYIDALAAGYYLGPTYSAVENVTIAGSLRNEQFIVAVGSAITANLSGNAGDDTFTVGAGNLSGYFPQILSGGSGVDKITFDDSLNPAGKIWDVNPDFHPNEVLYGGLVSLDTTGFESVGILAGLGNDNIYIYNDLTQNLDINAGAGADLDIVRWQGASNWYRNPVGGAVTSYTVNLNGGNSGFDVLILNESSRAEFEYDVYTASLFGTNGVDGASINYSGFGSLTLDASNYFNVFNAYALNPATSYWFSGFGDSDVMKVFADPTTGGANLRFDGGAGTDAMHIDDSGYTADVNYTVNVGNTQRVSGAASRFFTYNTLEQLYVTGTSGANTFTVPSLSTARPLILSGAAGDDVFNVTGAAMGTALATSLTIHGNDGYDVMNMNDAAVTAATSYTVFAGTFQRNNTNLPNTTLERIDVNAGTGNDDMVAFSMDPGLLLIVNGGDGNDRFFNGGLNCNGIQGLVEFFGQGGADNRVILQDFLDTAGAVAHLDQNSIGGYAGDNLFGPGGWLYFSDVARLVIDFGSGADTLYAPPNALATLFLRGNNPTSAPGDTLNLALAGADGPVFTPGAIGAGGYVFDNRRPLNYAGFETTAEDAVAPALTGIIFDPSILGQSLAFGFDDDVSASLSKFSLYLYNYTTGAYLSWDDIDYAYAGNAATFTFPTLGGVLPAGSYSATLSGAADPTGNAAADTFRVALDATAAMVEVYENGGVTPAYIADAATLGMVALHGGLEDDALEVDLLNGMPIPADGIRFDGGDGADTLALRGSAAADDVDFDADAITVNAGIVSHANVEQRTFDGAGGGDDLTINAGVVALTATQNLGSLEIASGAALDVRDHAIVIDYSSVSPVGIWTGSTYDGVIGMIKSGRNGGAWDGSGIVSSLAGNANRSSVAVAEAFQKFNLGATESALFAGHVVDSTCALVRYTYGGDANLDGKINIDDYGRIDSNVSKSGTVFGWFNGDFNYDGKINIDDYGIIDSNIGRQNAPLTPGDTVSTKTTTPSASNVPAAALRSPRPSPMPLPGDEEDTLLVLSGAADELIP